MPRKIVLTGDDTPSLYSSVYQQHYHSTHGAWQESMHVFIRAGLQNPALAFFKQREMPLQVLEMGFGTGLNALLTFAEEQWQGHPLLYTALEKHPLNAAEWQALHYPAIEKEPIKQALWQQIQQAPWNKSAPVEARRHLLKLHTDLLNWEPAQNRYHLIFYDAFAPDAQPELWTEEVFGKLYEATAPGGLLVTYCVKGSVRRALQAAGYAVEKIPGPPGKREMTRACKPQDDPQKAPL